MPPACCLTVPQGYHGRPILARHTLFRSGCWPFSGRMLSGGFRVTLAGPPPHFERAASPVHGLCPLLNSRGATKQRHWRPGGCGPQGFGEMGCSQERYRGDKLPVMDRSLLTSF